MVMIMNPARPNIDIARVLWVVYWAHGALPQNECFFVRTKIVRLNKLVKRVFHFFRVSAPTQYCSHSHPHRPLSSHRCYCNTCVPWCTKHPVLFQFRVWTIKPLGTSCKRHFCQLTLSLSAVSTSETLNLNLTLRQETNLCISSLAFFRMVRSACSSNK